MLKFDKTQKIVEIGSTRIGGQPGENPTALIGSIFYERHKIVSDAKNGIFDTKAAALLLTNQETVAEKTGNPAIIDIVGSSAQALIRYIDFVTARSDRPFLVDGPAPDVRLAAIKHCGEVGLLDRAIYNSIDENVKPEELTALKDLGVKSAVILAFNSRDPRVEGRIRILNDPQGQQLLSAAATAGIENIIVDTAVLDAPSIGTSARTVYVVKKEFGVPAGCAPSNAIYSWSELRKLGSHAFDSGIAAAHAFPIAYGADFILYGPIKYADYVFPACAIVDAFIAYDSRWRGIRPHRQHPLYKIF
jgi:tetrahydromethanopterin S-methyltransferase subunit H